jgi:hypothetical protein
MVGNGTEGFIRICLATNNIPSVGTSCSPSGICNPPYNGGVARIAIHNSDGVTHSGVALASWNSNTANNTCYTVSTNNGYAAIFGLCLTGNTLITWNTVDAQGQDVCTNSLPVTLIDFSAEKKGDDIQLKWVTASEFNSSHFIVKKSIDAINYTDVCSVKSIGTSIFTTNYSCVDKDTSTAYYILEQYDVDGVMTLYGPIAYNRIKEIAPPKYYTVLGIYMGDDYDKLELYICMKGKVIYKLFKR